MLKEGIGGFCMALEIPKAAMNIENFQILACLAGVALVAGMQLIKERSEKHGN